jgi:hypothetical protein
VAPKIAAFSLFIGCFEKPACKKESEDRLE